MMAESLPFPVGNPVPTWELEAWYEDLEEVLSLDVSSRTDPPAVEGQELEAFDLEDTPLLWDLEAAPEPLEASGSSTAETGDLGPLLTADLLELLGAEEPAGTSDSSRSSPPQTGTDDDDEASTGRKRKRCGQAEGSKRRRGREREQRNECRVAELTAQNEHLRREIERLSAEVEATREALIQRMVNLKS